MPTFILLLSILLPPVAMPAPILTGPGQVAQQEDVNILVYGVLQLSEALHNFYDSTTQKLDRIRHKAGIYEQGLRGLHHQTQDAQQGQEEIRGLVERLKAEDVQLRQEAQGGEKGLQTLLAGHRHLGQRMKALQEMLDIVEEQGLQDREQGPAALKQNGTIWTLLGATQQQRMVQQMEQLHWIRQQAGKRDQEPYRGQTQCKRQCNKTQVKQKERIVITGAENHSSWKVAMLASGQLFTSAFLQRVE